MVLNLLRTECVHSREESEEEEGRRCTVEWEEGRIALNIPVGPLVGVCCSDGDGRITMCWHAFVKTYIPQRVQYSLRRV